MSTTERGYTIEPVQRWRVFRNISDQASDETGATDYRLPIAEFPSEAEAREYVEGFEQRVAQ